MTDVRGYEPTAETEAFVALLGTARVPVHRSRARAYPGLEGPAPNTLGAYRVAQHALGKRKAVLDVGCGAAAGARTLVGPGRGVTGVDPSAEAVAFARWYAPSVRLVHGTLATLEPDERFDAVTVADVLGLLADPIALLAAARARLGEQGALVVAEARAAPGAELVAPARRAYTYEALEALLVRAGFLPEPVRAAPAEFVMAVGRPAAGERVADALARAEDPGTDPHEAIEQVSRALEGVANEVQARELLLAFGALHLRARDLDSAAGTFVGALRLAPKCARGLVGLGRVAERVQREREALRLYEKAAAHDPLAVDAWRALGELRAQLGDARGAGEALERAVLLAPADGALVEAFARVAGPSSKVVRWREALARYEGAPV